KSVYRVGELFLVGRQRDNCGSRAPGTSSITGLAVGKVTQEEVAVDHLNVRSNIFVGARTHAFRCTIVRSTSERHVDRIGVRYTSTPGSDRSFDVDRALGDGRTYIDRVRIRHKGYPYTRLSWVLFTQQCFDRALCCFLKVAELVHPT